MVAYKRKKRFENLHRPLTPGERQELEASIEANGCLDPIVVNAEDVILDGHNREQICRELEIEPPSRVIDLADDEAEEWILRHQLGRRNLSHQEYKLAWGRLYNAHKAKQGGDKVSSSATPRKNQTKGGKAKDQNGLLVSSEKSQKSPGVESSTAKKLSKEIGVGEMTVKRAGKYAEAFDSLPEAMQTKIRQEPKLASDKAVIKLADLSEEEQLRVARDVRVGKAKTFDAALGITTKPGSAKVSAAKLVDELSRKHMGCLVRGIDEVAKANGGKGGAWREANDALNYLIAALKKMRAGEK